MSYTNKSVAAISVASLVMLSCTAVGQTPGATAAGQTACAAPATYRVQVETVWSAGTHPLDFPAGPHFSPPVAATHAANAAFWAPGASASAGVEVMAETGNPRPLRAEIEAQITAGNVYAVGVGGRFDSPGQNALEIEADGANPYLSVVTMIAPSPDWFIGVSGLDLCDNGVWVTSQSVALNAYDAGTDSGASFTSANAETLPAQPIHPLGQDTNPASVRLASAPFGTLQITRVR